MSDNQDINYFVHMVKLPPSCYGLVRENEDNTYAVLVNRNIPREKQQETVKHELEHIRLGHLGDDRKTVAQKELEINA